MASKLIVSNTVLIPVKGVIADDDGKNRPFNFSLVCVRKGAAELKDIMESERLISEFLGDVTTGWAGVQESLWAGDVLPFSKEGLDSLLDVAGIGQLCFNAYLKGVGAKEKN